MKTNVTMLSPDRELFGIKIRQQSKTGHMNLSDLQGAYSVARLQHGWSDRNAYDVLSTVSNAERVFYVLKERGFIQSDFSDFMEGVESQGLVKVLKQAGAYKMSGRGDNRTTWCDPYVWILIAMELNPMVYAKTVMWLTDSLLLNRIEAGNFYKGFSAALKTFPRVDYARMARALNWVVFGGHASGVRDTATAAELKELASLEEKMAFAVQMGYIRNEAQMLGALKQLYMDKFDNGTSPVRGLA